MVIEADEPWSVVGGKRCVPWVRVAVDADTRRVVAMVTGDRSASTAECLWLARPAAYRDGAVLHADCLPAYRAVRPDERHAAGRCAGLTDHVERFWRTARRRCARLVRKTLTVSKRLENHLGALWFFIHLYNSSR